MSNVLTKIIDGREFLEHRQSKLRVQRKTVNPSAGEIWMRCGKCGGMSMRPLMRPVKGSARVVALVCNDSRGGGCMALFKVDHAGCLEKGGSVNELNKVVTNGDTPHGKSD